MSLRRRRSRGEKPKAAVDMTSLIDLTFLLLVTFIVTLPTIEQAIPIKLPQGKAEEIPHNQGKPNTITIDALNRIFFNDKPIAFEELEKKLTSMVEADPNVPVLVRGDERLEYSKIMDVIKILHKCKVRKMSLITVEN